MKLFSSENFFYRLEADRSLRFHGRSTIAFLYEIPSSLLKVRILVTDWHIHAIYRDLLPIKNRLET